MKLSKDQKLLIGAGVGIAAVFVFARMRSTSARSAMTGKDQVSAPAGETVTIGGVTVPVPASSFPNIPGIIVDSFGSGVKAVRDFFSISTLPSSPPAGFVDFT